MDKIIIKNLEVFAYHGCNTEEKENGQPFFLDIVLFTDISSAAEADDLNNTINYSKAVKNITATMTEKSYDLIETAASKVADNLLAAFDNLLAVNVILKKPNAPVKAKFDYMAVEIYRERTVNE
jgi:dihydroneopterin aldolase